ncbi:MAG: ABC transporter ATP-binding protein/permease [Clostridiales bacterium]|nr:ABC transporter ATP-binding protein/permease [Clostridiales bacterium]
MLKQLSRYMDGYWKYVGIGTIAMIIEVVCELMLPSIMAQIVKYITGLESANALATADTGFFLRRGFLMIGLTLVGMTGGILCARCSAKASQGYGASLRGSMFRKIADFSFHNIDKFSTASLTTRMTNDVTNIQNTIMMSLRILVRAPSMLVMAAIFAFSIDAQLSSLILLAIPLIGIGVVLVMRFGFPLFQRMQRRIDAVNSTVQENLIGIRVVKSYVREEHEKEKFKTSNENLMKAGMKAANLMVMAMPLMILVFSITTIALIWFGGNQINAGSLETGSLVSLIQYIMQILMSVMMVAVILIQVVRARACAERISEVLSTDIDITTPENAVQEMNGRRVEFDNVSFKYQTDSSGEDILSHISFTGEPGEFAAVIGGTGSGKSSLVSLIPRLYDVSGGRVLIDGKDVREYDLKTLRDSIGVVLQNNTLFSGTIRENLLWGKEDATEEEILAASKAAQAHDFIMEQPDGYDTYLAQGGLNLSGGQKQRMCIARAMIKQPNILILDDSTSAVDATTEASIREAFHRELKDTTVIMIAQRISSVDSADKIIVLDDGGVADIGTHQELLERCSIYQEIYETQQKGVLAE